MFRSKNRNTAFEFTELPVSYDSDPESDTMAEASEISIENSPSKLPFKFIFNENESDSGLAALRQLAQGSDITNIRLIPIRFILKEYQQQEGSSVQLEMAKPERIITKNWNNLYENLLRKGAVLYDYKYSFRNGLCNRRNLSFDALIDHMGLSPETVKDFIMLQEAINCQLLHVASENILELRTDKYNITNILKTIREIHDETNRIHWDLFGKILMFNKAITTFSGLPFMPTPYHVLPIFNPYDFLNASLVPAEGHLYQSIIEDYEVLLKSIFNSSYLLRLLLNDHSDMLEKLLRFGQEHVFSEAPRFYLLDIVAIIVESISSSSNPSTENLVDWLISFHMEYCNRPIAYWLIQNKYNEPQLCESNPFEYMFYASLVYRFYGADKMTKTMPQKTENLEITEKNIKEGELYFRGIAHIIETVAKKHNEDLLPSESSNCITKIALLYPLQASNDILSLLLDKISSRIPEQIRPVLREIYLRATSSENKNEEEEEGERKPQPNFQ